MLQTVVRSEKSKRKQVTMTKSTYEYLKTTSEEDKRQISKGLIIYEAIMQERDYLTDDLDRYEQRIDRDLVELTSQSFLTELNRIRFEDENGYPRHRNLISPYSETTDDPISIHLPVSLLEELEENWGRRYWADHIDSVLIDYLDSAYEHRSDRIDCKRQLIAYLEDTEDPDHPVAQAILRGFESPYTISKARTILMQEEWYERDTIEWKMFKENGEEDIPRNMEFRKDVLEKALDDYAEYHRVELSKEKAAELTAQAYDIAQITAEKEYIPDIDLPDYSDKTELDALIDEINKDQSDIELPDLKKLNPRNIKTKHKLISIAIQNEQNQKLHTEDIEDFVPWSDDIKYDMISNIQKKYDELIYQQ